MAVKGQIVQVAFDVLQPLASGGNVQLPPTTIPIATSAYDWVPIQVGDKGYTVAADTYMGGVSGLGGGVADLSSRGNLTNLVFHPVANSNWTPGGGASGDMRVITGPGGVVIYVGNSTFTVTPTQITMTAGGKTLLIGSAGITLDGILWETHEHTEVTIGGENSGPPTGP